MTECRALQVHGKKAVVNFRMTSGEIQWQPRNKRGMSNSSAETSCPSFGVYSHPSHLHFDVSRPHGVLFLDRVSSSFMCAIPFQYF